MKNKEIKNDITFIEACKLLNKRKEPLVGILKKA